MGYISYFETILNSGPYTFLNQDSSTDKLKEVKQSVLLSGQTNHMIIPSIVNCAWFCAVPKIHKPTPAFCPIVSNGRIASYEVAHFIAQSLVHSTCNNFYSVKISYDLVDKLKLISSSNYSMCSFDVKSLFTNVPILGALDCLEKRFHEFHYSSTEIEQIHNLVHFCIRQTTFFFSKVFFISKLKAWE